MDCFPRTPFEVSDETGINMVVDGVSNYMVVLCFSARYCIRGRRNAPPSKSDGWCTRVRLLDGVEEVLRR